MKRVFTFTTLGPLAKVPGEGARQRRMQGPKFLMIIVSQKPNVFAKFASYRLDIFENEEGKHVFRDHLDSMRTVDYDVRAALMNHPDFGKTFVEESLEEKVSAKADVAAGSVAADGRLRLRRKKKDD